MTAEISEAGGKRARYQEMAAEGLIGFEELQARLAAVEGTRKTAERGFHAVCGVAESTRATAA